MNDTLKLCYWLQGFAEINGKAPTKKQWKEIRKRIEECDGADDGEGLMSAGTFINWIKGFIELSNPDNITSAQWNVIKEHLQLVFTKVTTKTVEDNKEDILKTLEKIKEKSEKNPNPWKQPGPQWNPNRRICSSGETLPIEDKTFCMNMNTVACSVYESDPVV